MTFVDDSVAPLLDPNADPANWVTAMDVILSDELWANTWSNDAGSADRVVFLFGNGLRLSWVSDGCGGLPELLQAWVDPQIAAGWYTPTLDKSAPMDCPISVPDLDSWWNTITQTWDFTVEPSTVVTLVNHAVAKYGPCTLGLPWEPFTNGGGAVEEAAYDMPTGVLFTDIVANLDGDKIEEITSSFEDEGIEIAGPILMAASLQAVTLPAVWGSSTTVAMGDAWMPAGSPNVRFMALMEHLGEQPEWVVDWNECCGSCAGSSIDMLAQDKGLTRQTAKSIVLYGQNAQYAWRPDGTVDYDVYLSDQEQVNALLVEAGKFRVDAHAHDSDMTVHFS